jgi:hypothetical protein
MQHARSLLLSPPAIVAAQDVDYGDCEDFQIVCLACSEPVFKGVRATTGRHYFSHYKLVLGAKCELRVAQIVRQRLNISVSNPPKGQELDRFLSRFGEIMLEGGDHHGVISREICRMNARPAYRQLIYVTRPLVRDMAFGSPTTPGWLPSDGRMDADLGDVLSAGSWETLKLVLQYLNAANSFGALLFAASFGVLYFRTELFDYQNHPDEGSGLLKEMRENGYITTLHQLSDRKLRSFLGAITKDARDMSEARRLGMYIAIGVCYTATVFVSKIAG